MENLMGGIDAGCRRVFFRNFGSEFCKTWKRKIIVQRGRSYWYIHWLMRAFKTKNQQTNLFNLLILIVLQTAAEREGFEPPDP